MLELWSNGIMAQGQDRTKFQPTGILKYVEETAAKKFTNPIELKFYHLRVCPYFIVSVLEEGPQIS